MLSLLHDVCLGGEIFISLTLFYFFISREFYRLIKTRVQNIDSLTTDLGSWEFHFCLLQQRMADIQPSHKNKKGPIGNNQHHKTHLKNFLEFILKNGVKNPLS